MAGMDIHQVTRPDHGGWPDEKSSIHACHTEADHLTCDHEKQLETPSEELLVENLLSKKDIGRLQLLGGESLSRWV